MDLNVATIPIVAIGQFGRSKYHQYSEASMYLFKYQNLWPIFFSLNFVFLVANKRLYIRVGPSVRPWSVRCAFFSNRGF